MKDEKTYREPGAYIADIEVMTNKSYGTCKRIMQRIRLFYGLSGRERPTIEQVKKYLVEI